MYHRVTGEERGLIYRWGQEGCRKGEIARLLGRAPSSIGREIRRNTGGNGYRPQQADEKARARTRRPVHRRFTDEVRAEAEQLIRAGWTPEMIGGRARMEERA